MSERINEFIELNKLFKEHGFNLYLVGGTVRDYLLGLPLDDMDVVTDALPEEIKEFLPSANFHFAKYGSVQYKTEKKVKFDITTLREESSYSDSRHPGEIKFVKELEVDAKRRDFTVNAMYMDIDLKPIDFYNGLQDLDNRVLRMIGDPDKRLKEDSLRIIRALRFAVDFDLSIEESLGESIKNNAHLLANLNIDKVKQDIRKLKGDETKLFALFEIYNINKFINVID